jgi:uncharacterized protein YndB with AHSA1/START domain
MKSEVTTDERSIRIKRVFQAPRPLVYSWWTDGSKLQQWSGCKEATNCRVEMDFRVGGGFTQTMQIAGAGEFTLRGRYLEIVENERIVYSADLGPVTTRVTVEFFEHEGGTKVVLTHEGLPDEFLRNTISQGTAESFDKLDTAVGSRAVAVLP